METDPATPPAGGEATSSSAAAAEQIPPPPGLNLPTSAGQKRTHESPADETPLPKKTEVPAGTKRDMRSIMHDDDFWVVSAPAADDRSKRSREVISSIIAVIKPNEEEEEKQQEDPEDDGELDPAPWHKPSGTSSSGSTSTRRSLK
jgi:hypothetical protein